MKLTETIVVAKPHLAAAGTPIDSYELSDKSLEVLVRKLNKNGLKIDYNHSEKQVRYGVQTLSGSEERTSTVPLRTKFPFHVNIIIGYLRNEYGTLELELSHYAHTTRQPPRGVRGGTVSGEYGISCKITLEDTLKVDVSIIGKVKAAMEKTYVKPDRGTDDDFKFK